jgi:hypothetical protein
MADSDYTVAVVLQASDEGMSSTIKKSSGEVKKLGENAKKTQRDLLTTVVALEGLTSGLNQVTGGLRKYSAALQQTGLLEKEEAEAFNKKIALLELATGPLETTIALQKILTIATMGSAAAKTADAGATGTAAAANTVFGVSIYFVLGGLFILVAILAILIIHFEQTERIVSAANVKMAQLYIFLNMIYFASKQAAEGMKEFAESVVAGGDAVADLLGPGGGNGPVVAMGGGATL